MKKLFLIFTVLLTFTATSVYADTLQNLWSYSGKTIEPIKIYTPDKTVIVNTRTYSVPNVGKFEYFNMGTIRDSYVVVSCTRGVFRFRPGDSGMKVTVTFSKNGKDLLTVETDTKCLHHTDDDLRSPDSFIISGNLADKIWNHLSENPANSVTFSAPRSLTPADFNMTVPGYSVLNL